MTDPVRIPAEQEFRSPAAAHFRQSAGGKGLGGLQRFLKVIKSDFIAIQMALPTSLTLQMVQFLTPPKPSWGADNLPSLLLLLVLIFLSSLISYFESLSTASAHPHFRFKWLLVEAVSVTRDLCVWHSEPVSQLPSRVISVFSIPGIKHH